MARFWFPGMRAMQWTSPSPFFLLGVALLQASLITLIGYSEGLYEHEGDWHRQTGTLVKAALLGSAVLCFALHLQHSSWTVTSLIGGAGLLHFGSLWSWRRWHDGNSPADTTITKNVLIVGAGPVGQRLASFIERHPSCGRQVCGFLDDEWPVGGNVVGCLSDLATMARKGFVDEVILAAPHDAEVALRVLREAKRLHLDLQIVPEMFGCDPAGQPAETLAGLPVICVHEERSPAVGLLAKRAIDVVGAGVGLILLSPLLGAIAALIRLDSPGPVLYVAKRAGRKGRLFRCYKFRTMVSDADQKKGVLREKNQRSGPIFKIADDPRITRVGRLLRRYSLDELPQLWNIFKGEMSLVGPRPHPAEEFAAYELGHLSRLDVTPGLTGLWQVSARRDPSFERAMELDREYIRSWNLKLDLQILMRTVVAVARGSGD